MQELENAIMDMSGEDEFADAFTYKPIKSSSEEPQLVQVNGGFKDGRGVFVYDPDTNILAIAPWNRMHASIIEEV